VLLTYCFFLGAEYRESLGHDDPMFKPGWKDIFRMNQNELESEIRKVYRDSTLDPRRKAYLVQNLLTRLVPMVVTSVLFCRTKISVYLSDSALAFIDIKLQPLIGFLSFNSRWIAAQQKSPKALSEGSSNSVDIVGLSPSFRDPEKHVFGCDHYKRNCKLRAECCGKLFTCRFCHDNVSDHSMDR